MANSADELATGLMVMTATTVDNGADANERDQARPRGARWVTLAAMLVALGSAGSILADRIDMAELFPLRAVRFDGDLGHVREQDLRDAAQPHLHGGLLGVDVSALRAAVESLPWVAAAAVRRVWPDALRVTVTEQVPVAVWGGGALLNADGDVFRPQTVPEGLPRLAGPPGSETRVLERFARVADVLAGVGLVLSGLALDARRSWTARLANGGRIVLGRDKGRHRLARFVRSWPHLAAGREASPRSVDLRYPNGFAIQWDARQGDGSAPARKD